MTQQQADEAVTEVWRKSTAETSWQACQKAMAIVRMADGRSFSNEAAAYSAGLARMCLAVYGRLPSTEQEPAPEPLPRPEGV